MGGGLAIEGQLALTALVLFAAVLHAGWNAVVKSASHSEENKLLTPALVVGTAAIAGLALTPFAEIPAPASWPFIALSVVLHTAYFTFLVFAYRFGDLGQVYPIARGTSPLLVALAAGPLVAETTGALSVAGVVLISLGVGSLALGRGGDFRAVGLAFATGAMIAAYTVVDALGVRAAGSTLGYIAWLNFLMSLPFSLCAFFVARREAAVFLRHHWRPGVAGGIMTMTAYGLVLWALTLGALAPVAALRETSVIFAAILGVLFLGEPFGRRRILAATVVASGVVLLNLPG